MKKKRVGVLISGRGSNMLALIEAARASDYPAEIAFVFSNRPNAGGIETAARLGIATLVIDHRKFATREEFDAAVNKSLQEQELDLIACAGFMSS